MKILIADKFPKHWEQVLKEKGFEIVANPALDENTLPSAQSKEQAEIIIVRSTKVNAATVEASPKLKLIIRAGAGYDTIDVQKASERKVAVCNCPGTNSIAVAELAFALILGIDRHIADNVADFRSGIWNKNLYSKSRGVYGKTLGVVGLGNIGREVIKRAKAFGMKIVGYSPNLTEEGAAGMEIEMAKDIYEVAEKSDIITVHMPGTPETKGVFNKKFFDLMKNGSYFINTSRGSLVNQKDLLAAIKEKGIQAGLDVYENEPKADAKEFVDEITKEKCICGTHHIGASTDQAQDAVAELAVKIIEKFQKEGKFLHQVNK